MRAKKTDPELPLLLPFQPGIVSNGEFVPPEPTLTHRRHRNAAAHCDDGRAGGRRVWWGRLADRIRIARSLLYSDQGAAHVESIII